MFGSTDTKTNLNDITFQFTGLFHNKLTHSHNVSQLFACKLMYIHPYPFMSLGLYIFGNICLFFFSLYTLSAIYHYIYL